MGMKKKFRVSFDVKVAMSHEQEKAFMEALVTLAEMPNDLTPAGMHAMCRALQEGPEAALEEFIKSGVRKLVKEHGIASAYSDLNELATVTQSPTRVVVTR